MTVAHSQIGWSGGLVIDFHPLLASNVRKFSRHNADVNRLGDGTEDRGARANKAIKHRRTALLTSIGPPPILFPIWGVLAAAHAAGTADCDRGKVDQRIRSHSAGKEFQPVVMARCGLHVTDSVVHFWRQYSFRTILQGR
jgi:hypothetical protein